MACLGPGRRPAAGGIQVAEDDRRRRQVAEAFGQIHHLHVTGAGPYREVRGDERDTPEPGHHRHPRLLLVDPRERERLDDAFRLARPFLEPERDPVGAGPPHQRRREVEAKTGHGGKNVDLILVPRPFQVPVHLLQRDDVGVVVNVQFGWTGRFIALRADSV